MPTPDPTDDQLAKFSRAFGLKRADIQGSGYVTITDHPRYVLLYVWSAGAGKGPGTGLEIKDGDNGTPQSTADGSALRFGPKDGRPIQGHLTEDHGGVGVVLYLEL